MSNHPLDLSSAPLELVERDFHGLYSGPLSLSSIKGGQSAADQALKGLDISGYADHRSKVLPTDTRGATVLSPYIRHNILTLQRVHDHVATAPFKDREKYRDELFWQEYARHLYARLGTRLFSNLRFVANENSPGEGWNRELLCVDTVLRELETDGWLVNQTRMWLASQWTVRSAVGWIDGQEKMFRELVDGSRAANLLGWQWTVGAGTGKPYGFSRWQVEKQAPGLCFKCPLKKKCPIQEFPAETSLDHTQKDPLLDSDPDVEHTAGPINTVQLRKPQLVLLTIESLGDADPALAANPELPVVFIFNKSALEKLQLSAKRIGFYIETLQDLQQRRDLQVLIGNPYEFAQHHDVAVTYAPVPSFKKFTSLAQVHPYPWLRKPYEGSVRSYTAWRQKIDRRNN
jgi:deoxyribodipyrimidine photo-lyase